MRVVLALQLHVASVSGLPPCAVHLISQPSPPSSSPYIPHLQIDGKMEDKTRARFQDPRTRNGVDEVTVPGRVVISFTFIDEVIS